MNKMYTGQIICWRKDLEKFSLGDGGYGSLEVPVLRYNNAEGQDPISPGLLMVNEPVWQRHVLFLNLLLRVLYKCLDWNDFELAPWENPHWSYPIWRPPL